MDSQSNQEPCSFMYFKRTTRRGYVVVDEGFCRRDQVPNLLPREWDFRIINQASGVHLLFAPHLSVGQTRTIEASVPVDLPTEGELAAVFADLAREGDAEDVLEVEDADDDLVEKQKRRSTSDHATLTAWPVRSGKPGSTKTGIVTPAIALGIVADFNKKPATTSWSQLAAKYGVPVAAVGKTLKSAGVFDRCIKKKTVGR